MKPAAKWTAVRKDVVSAADPDGRFVLSAPLLDDGVRVVTVTVTVSPDRALRVDVLSEGAALTDFQCWLREV